MNGLQTFDNPEFGAVRTIYEDGRPLFVGADIAGVLGYARPSEAVVKHCRGTLKRRIGVQTGRRQDGSPAMQASKTSILVGELAKLLKQNGIDMGQNRLFEWLRAHGYLISRRGTDYNMPTQYSMERGLFEIKESTISHSDGHISINKTPKVTGKGQIYFIEKLRRPDAE